jgi:hypothetical protein
VAEAVALTIEQIAAQKEAADRDRQRQLEWAVVISRSTTTRQRLRGRCDAGTPRRRS